MLGAKSGLLSQTFVGIFFMILILLSYNKWQITTMEADVRLTFDSVLPLVLEASDVYWRQLHVEEINVDVGQVQGKRDALCILR